MQKKDVTRNDINWHRDDSRQVESPPPAYSDEIDRVKAAFDKWAPCRKPVKRPSWDDFFLGMAHYAKLRSHDAQTGCGCIITDHTHHVLGVGYNGFPPDINDVNLPNMRPYKYPWMKHAEYNAIANCKLRPIVGGIAYVTMPPCHDCLTDLWTNGIREIVYDSSTPLAVMLNDEQRELTDVFLFLTKGRLIYRGVTPDMSHLEKLQLDKKK